MYHGDFRLGDTLDIKFCTVSTTGAPTTLAGTPSVAAYPGNSTTEITAGITLTVDFDARTGMHNVRVVATSGNGYATATNYTLVITSGTVGGTSVVGYCVGSFSIENRSALMPATAARTLIVSAAGAADADAVMISNDATAANNLETAYDDTAGSVPWDGIVDQGTAQAATGTTLQLRAAAAFADNELNGATIVIVSATTGAGQRRLINSYVGATDTATVDTWTTTPTGTIIYKIFGTAPSSGGSAPSAATVAAAVWDEARASHTTAGSFGQGVASVQGNVTGSAASVTGAVGSVTAAVTVGTNNDKTGYRLSATGVDDILDDPLTEPSGVFSWASATLRNVLAYIGAKASNRQTETATTYVLRNRANTVDIATSTNSDDGTTTIKGSDA